MKRRSWWKAATAGLAAGGIVFFSWWSLWYWAVDYLEGSIPLETIGAEG